MYVVLLLIYTFYYSTLAAENITDCHHEKCYQTVNNSLTNLNNLINQLNSTSSKAIYDMDNIRNDIEEAEAIKKELENRKQLLDKSVNKLTQTNKTIIKDQTAVTLMLEKLSNISEYQANAASIRGKAEIYQTNLQKFLELGENASKSCQQARSKYLEFKKILQEFEDKKESYKALNSQTQELNNIVKQVFQETIKTRNTFEKLQLPKNLVDDFVVKAQNNFNETIESLKNNVNLLKGLLEASQQTWNQMLQSYERSVAQSISDLESDLKMMNKDLENYQEAFTVKNSFEATFNEESKNLLNKIKQKLIKAETDFKAIKFSDNEEEMLRKNDKITIAEIKKYREQIKSYKLIIEALLVSEEKIKKIQEEINTLKTTINLLEQWNYLNEKLKRLRIYRDEILKVNCSEVNDGAKIVT